jgi:hypothetical protein
MEHKEPSNPDKITTVNDVDLYASKDRVYFDGWSLSVEWGEYYSSAEKYRDMCRYAEEFEKMATVGYLFECLWGASNHWLWKNTNDSIISSRTLEGVSNMDYTYDYGLADTIGTEVVELIYSYIERNEEVQDSIIESRCNRLTDSNIISEVHTLHPRRYTGEIEITGVLFDDEDEEEFYEEAENMAWLDSPRDYINRTFEKSSTREDNTVVSPDSYCKPIVKTLEEIVTFDKRFSHCLSKVIETAPYRDDVDIRFNADYGTNRLEIEII